MSTQSSLTEAVAVVDCKLVSREFTLECKLTESRNYDLKLTFVFLQEQSRKAHNHDVITSGLAMNMPGPWYGHWHLSYIENKQETGRE